MTDVTYDRGSDRDTVTNPVTLTIHMFLLWPHDFVRGRLAHRFGHGGTGNAVLRCSNPVRYALSRHLRGFKQTEKGENKKRGGNLIGLLNPTTMLAVPGMCTVSPPDREKKGEREELQWVR